MEGRGISYDTDGRVRRLLRRLRRSDRGVGLIELLAVIPMLAATLLATYALYNVASKSQARTDNRAQGLIRNRSASSGCPASCARRRPSLRSPRRPST